MALEATKEMCFLCFETLESATTNCPLKLVSSRLVSDEDHRACPMFVTWNLSGRLRGCIGCFDDLPLWKGLQEYAISAGMKDYRFGAIASAELHDLSVTVSLLHSFENCTNPTDWEIGVHGIRLFVDGRRSTYLPEVAKEQRWGQAEALRHLAAKGGFPGEYGADALARSKVIRYQSSKISATWDEYQAFIKTCRG
jgi:uncharacterized protein (TIGR00296 family)